MYPIWIWMEHNMTQKRDGVFEEPFDISFWKKFDSYIL